MENQHDIVSHSLLSNQDFLVTIDDKVATLVISALSSIFYDAFFVQSWQVTEFWTNHDWNFTNGYLVLLEYLTLRFDGWLVRDRVLLTILDLEDLHSTEDLGLIGQATNPCCVRHDWLVRAITFVQARELVDCGPAKFNFVRRLFIIWTEILPVFLNGLLSELFNDFLDWVLQEALKRENLLSDKTILFEVTINYLPAIILVNWLHVKFAGINFDVDTRVLPLHFLSLN